MFFNISKPSNVYLLCIAYAHLEGRTPILLCAHFSRFCRYAPRPHITAIPMLNTIFPLPLWG